MVFILFFFLLVFVSFFVLVFSPGLLGCQLLELLLFHIKYSALFCALTAYKKKWSCGVVFDFFSFFFFKEGSWKDKAMGELFVKWGWGRCLSWPILPQAVEARWRIPRTIRKMMSGTEGSTKAAEESTEARESKASWLKRLTGQRSQRSARLKGNCNIMGQGARLLSKPGKWLLQWGSGLKQGTRGTVLQWARNVTSETIDPVTKWEY